MKNHDHLVLLPGGEEVDLDQSGVAATTAALTAPEQTESSRKRMGALLGALVFAGLTTMAGCGSESSRSETDTTSASTGGTAGSTESLGGGGTGGDTMSSTADSGGSTMSTTNTITTDTMSSSSSTTTAPDICPPAPTIGTTPTFLQVSGTGEFSLDDGSPQYWDGINGDFQLNGAKKSIGIVTDPQFADCTIGPLNAANGHFFFLDTTQYPDCVSDVTSAPCQNALFADFTTDINVPDCGKQAHGTVYLGTYKSSPVSTTAIGVYFPAQP